MYLYGWTHFLHLIKMDLKNENKKIKPKMGRITNISTNKHNKAQIN